ncbi:MAG: hypothetical protein Q8P81_03920 [Nanoarchaeota archaeon]|nr:hypothetical protein [Nanoarchaeota archaeon]
MSIPEWSRIPYEELVSLRGGGLEIVSPLDERRNCIVKVRRRENEGCLVLKIGREDVDVERNVLEKTADSPDHTPYLVDYWRVRYYRCILKEFIEGERLDDGLLDQTQYAHLAETVGYLHGKGICNLDIEGGNILITLGGRPRLFDFDMCELDGSPLLIELDWYNLEKLRRDDCEQSSVSPSGRAKSSYSVSNKKTDERKEDD